MAGYSGYSMSNNAVAAYENGEKPLSKWTKGEIIDLISEYRSDLSIKKLKQINADILKKEFLMMSGWHHTSKMYNRTYFYSFDTYAVSDFTEEALDKLIQRSIEKKVVACNGDGAKKAEAPKYECSFLEWGGSRRHPKATEVVEVGEIRGDWFYREDGSKKNIYGKGFKILREVE